MERINIEEKNIQFKQIVSGPAPVGRILNYINLAGRNVLKHVNGHRTINLVDNIGSAWTTEFMIGLGLLTVGREADIGNYLDLTENGNKIYEIIKDISFNFNEGINANTVKKEVEMICPDLFPVFEKVFRESVVFEILKMYLQENGYEFERTSFLNDYFEDLKYLYDESKGVYYAKDVRSTTVTTGGNRVPSLIQICEFFNYVLDANGKILFIKEQFDKEDILNIEGKTFSKEELEKAQTQENKIIKEIENLEEKYGVDGTVAIEAIVRNSSVQKMFRNNLIAEYGCRCMICGLENIELLVASHIKPAKDCDVYEKINNNNGLLLCANHDKLFDRYLITFQFDTGEIEVSNKVNQNDQQKLGINKSIKLDEKIMNEERMTFLALHNIEYHNKNGGDK